MKPFCHLFYRIPFSETDAMGIVHHGNHPLYLERGRIEMLRLIGLDYLELTKQGIHFPVLELSVQYKKPLKFDDIILIESSVELLTKTRLNIRYALYRVSEIVQPYMCAEAFGKEVLVTGISAHCSTTAEGRPMVMKEEIFSKLSTIFKDKK